MDFPSFRAFMTARAPALAPLAGDFCIVFKDGQALYVDPRQNPPVLEEAIRPAALVIETSLADLEALQEGSLSPMTAMFTGRLKVRGAHGMALKLVELLESDD